MIINKRIGQKTYRDETIQTVGMHEYGRKRTKFSRKLMYSIWSETEVMRINNTIDDGTVLDGGILEDVDSFTYLGSVIAKDGGADKDIKTRIGKARSAFLTLKPV